jgi:hypothetical protein
MQLDQPVDSEDVWEAAKKVELTAPDVVRMLETLWLRADDIPMKYPRERVAFDALVLIFSIAGSRPGMIISQIKYKDVALFLVRDPDDPSRRRLNATITLTRNKRRQGTVDPKMGAR